MPLLASISRRGAPVSLSILPEGAARRPEAESLIRAAFLRRHGAAVRAFSPDLMLLERAGRPVAAAGWRLAASGPLFLERYLDLPIEAAMAPLSDPPPRRALVAEVGHLASFAPGGASRLFLALAAHLAFLGIEWAAFTATPELLAILSRLGLSPAPLAVADPARLGPEASAWGRYYDSRPLIVAGPIRQAFDRLPSPNSPSRS